MHKKYIAEQKEARTFQIYIFFAFHSRIRSFLLLISNIALWPLRRTSRNRSAPTLSHKTKKKNERDRLLTASLAPESSVKHQTQQPRTNHFSESTMSHITRFSIVHTIRNTFEVSWGTKVSVTWHFNGRLYTDEVGWESGPYVEGVRRWTYRTGETSLLSLFLLPIEVFLYPSYTIPLP